MNGHGSPQGHVGADSDELSRPDTDREATRYLSAATHLDLKYAELVARGVVGESLRALAPAAGADVAVIARWALAALRRRAHRDAALALLLVAALVAAFLAWTWIPLAVMVVAAVLITAYERWVRLHKYMVGQMLRDRFDPEAAPASPNPADERRLAAVERQQGGNVVVFPGRKAFVGSGSRYVYRRMILNVHVGKRGKDGKRRKHVPFTTQELHDALSDALKLMGLADVHVQERLFVNGNHLSGIREILPDELKPPVPVASQGLLRSGAIHPTSDARTYVCAEMRGWKGQLVVSLFARAIQANGSLRIEWSFYVLPPLQSKFLFIDRCYKLPRRQQLLDCLKVGAIDAIPALLTAPGKLSRYLTRPIRNRRRKRRQVYAIKNGYVFNYGSLPSIREHARGLNRQHYFLEQDTLAYMDLAEHTLLRTIEKFLVQHKIDLELFESQQSTFIELVSNTNVGEIHATNVAVGKKSKVNDSSGEEKKS
jgi:hypothetical protein